MSSEPGEKVALGATDHDRDLAREVYCLLGLPIDRLSLDSAASSICTAADRGTPFLLSTPNLNFLIAAGRDQLLRESVLASDLSTPDGMPLIWAARLLGLPLRERVSGSDIYSALKQSSGRQLDVFFFGGANGIAARACHSLNREKVALQCVGAIDPGLGPVADMSRPSVIDAINATHADFLVVALGAKKGQEWLLRNHDAITVPVRSHLGAVINFQAGSVKRAPLRWQTLGLEWLWRIKEEPHLWRRYWADGLAFVRLLVSRVLPLAFVNAAARRRARNAERPLEATTRFDAGTAVIRLKGDATSSSVPGLIGSLKKTLNEDLVYLVIDLSAVRDIDQRFLGLLLVLRKVLGQKGARLTFEGVSARVRRIFHLNGCEYLLQCGPDLFGS